MTLPEFVAALEAAGVTFRVKGGELLFRGPQTALTDKARAHLARAKPRIIAYLAHREREEELRSLPMPEAPAPFDFGRCVIPAYRPNGTPVWWLVLRGLPDIHAGAQRWEVEESAEAPDIGRPEVEDVLGPYRTKEAARDVLFGLRHAYPFPASVRAWRARPGREPHEEPKSEETP